MNLTQDGHFPAHLNCFLTETLLESKPQWEGTKMVSTQWEKDSSHYAVSSSEALYSLKIKRVRFPSHKINTHNSMFILFTDFEQCFQP